MAFDARDYTANELLSMPVNEFPDGPPVLEQGYYYGVVFRQSQGPTPWNPATESILYHCGLTEPGPDIDPKDMVGIDLSSVNLPPVAYELIPSRMWAIKRLIKSFPDISQTLATDMAIPEVVTKKVLCFVTKKQAKRREGEDEREGNERWFNNIASIVGVPEVATSESVQTRKRA